MGRPCTPDARRFVLLAALHATDIGVKSRIYPWVVLLTLLFVYILNYTDRFLITGLIGPIKQHFNLGDGMIGVLMGPAFVILFVTLGIPIARYADRSSRIRIIATGCVFWSLATISTGLATGATTLLLARVAVGIGEAAFTAPAYSLIAAYFAPHRRGIAYAVLGLATYFGQIIGQAGGPAIAAKHDWHTAFYVMGGIGVVAGIVALMVIREPARATPDTGGAGAQPAIPFLTLVGHLLRTPSLVFMALAFGLGAMSGVAFGFWGPELFARSYAIDPAAAKAAFALNFGSAGLIGMLAFGFLSDRMSRRSMAWPVRLSGIAMAAATVAIIISAWSPTLAQAKLMAIPAGLLGGGWSVGFIATLQYILPDRFRAQATSIFLAFTTLFAFLLGPWLPGLFSQAMGDGADSLRMALTFIMPIAFPAALMALYASRRVEQDKQALAQL